METAENPQKLWLEALTVAAFCAFLFFFGLGAIGLTGADEPRYAQIAREMLARRDWVTPVLYGQAWLEKPPLYYWEATVSYKVFGVSDWAARIPSAASASAMVFGIFIFFRRRLPRGAIDAALITAACAACIGFAHAASTDMPLAATFTIAMLCWFAATHGGEDAELQGARGGAFAAPPLRRRSALCGFYLFLAFATLAKGPIAPGLAALIIVIYCAVTRKWTSVRATLWLPGIVLFFAIAAPWYIAVQLANPQFAREFFLQQNLARFGTNLYQHKQPFWYYVPVLGAAVVPWVVYCIAAFVRSLHRSSRNERIRIFLACWAAVPVVFFSFSQSKLPGYILPAIPAWTMLLVVFIHQHRNEYRPVWPLIVTHAAVAAALVSVAALLPAIGAKTKPTPLQIGIAVGAGVAFLLAIAFTLRRRGLAVLRFVTLAPVVIAFAYLVRIDAPQLDPRLSMRSLAAEVQQITARPVPVATFHARREVEYGLAFYLNERIANYERQPLLSPDHLVVAPNGYADRLAEMAHGRRISRVGEFPQQNLELFWISAMPKASVPN